MALWSVIALLAVAAAVSADRVIEISLDKAGTRRISTPNFPNRVKKGTRIYWDITSPPGTKVELICEDIRLSQKNPPGCDQDLLVIDIGKRTEEVCGHFYDYEVISDSNEMYLELSIGGENSGGISCTAGAFQELQEPTLPPAPDYLNIPSEEVDSSEHGGPPGPKTTSCPCGWANKDHARIVNGVEAKVNEYPFIVAVTDQWGGQFCGGSLITEYHVLTAAHCTAEYVAKRKKMGIIVGEHDLSKASETNATRLIPVVRIIQHSEYVPGIFKHDISLLELAERVQFNKWVGPVCLSPVQLEIPGQYVKIMGWGDTKSRGPSPTTLQKANVRVLNRVSCHKTLGSLVDYVNPTQVCVYASKKGVCFGDSGGPVVWLDPETNRFVQVGLASFVIECADDNPSVHTDVSAYYKWIHEKIRATLPRATCNKVG